MMPGSFGLVSPEVQASFERKRGVIFLQHRPLTELEARIITDRLSRPGHSDRYTIIVLDDPPILREIPTIAETIACLDRAIAAVRTVLQR